MSNALLLLLTARAPIAPRDYRGQMCGIHVPGAPPVPGGASDPSLILSWFYPRYPAIWRAKIRAEWKRIGALDVLVSWPDFDGTPQQFLAMCQELVRAGFRPNCFLSAKPTSADRVMSIDQTLAFIMQVLPLLVQARAISRMCVAWEAALWLSPDDLQFLIDQCAPMCVKAGIKCYQHFGPGKSSWQHDGQPFAGFWNANVGKLTGCYHEKIISQTPDQYRGDSGGLSDVLIRFAGNDGVSPDSGFDHPFDLVALEITAETQFDGTTSEADGNALGTWAIETPPEHGPAGFVEVRGSGNGQVL